MCYDKMQGMEEVVAKGLSRGIGISNFTITKTERLLQTAKIVPAVNQVECHPYFQQPKLKQYCDGKGLFALILLQIVRLYISTYPHAGIVLEAFGPLGAPARPAIADADPVVMEDPVIKQIAEKHNATPAQVC